MRYVKLPEIAEMGSGGTPSRKKKEYYKNGSVPWLKSGELNNGVVTSAEEYITEKAIKESSAKIAPKGSLLVAMYGATAGKVGLLDFESSMNQAVCFIKPDIEEADVRYLYYYLMSQNQELLDKREGGGQPNISQTILKSLKIPLPSLSEQIAIVAKLDRSQRLIDIDREMLAKYDELIQSVFLEMFGDPVKNPKGWELEKLGDLCGVGSSKRVYVKELVEEGIPFYRGQEIGKLSEGKALEPKLFVTEEHYQQLIDHSGKPEIGDLLMPSICPDGRIFIVKNNEKFYFKDGRVLWVKAGQSDINSFYLRYHLKALFQANYSVIASGTTFAELKIFALKKLQILNPPIELQERFQSKIERINQDIYRTKSSLKKSEDLFSSLVQGVF